MFIPRYTWTESAEMISPSNASHICRAVADLPTAVGPVRINTRGRGRRTAEEADAVDDVRRSIAGTEKAALFMLGGKVPRQLLVDLNAG